MTEYEQIRGVYAVTAERAEISSAVGQIWSVKYKELHGQMLGPLTVMQFIPCFAGGGQ